MVFALGFVLGTIRVLWLAPQTGVLAATALEIPVMLAASWWIAGRLMMRFGIVTNGAALAMGLGAFALLLVLEYVLAITLAGASPGQWLASFAEAHAMLGLAGQSIFAIIPWLRLVLRSNAAGT
jgi:hypothetical protein